MREILRDFAYAAAGIRPIDHTPDPTRCFLCGERFSVESNVRRVSDGGNECTCCERDRHIGPMRRTA